MSTLQHCLDEAYKFLTSENAFLDGIAEANSIDSNTHVAPQNSDTSLSQGSSATFRLAFKALNYLTSIQAAALVTEANEDPDLSPTAPLNGTQNRLTLNGLFEIIAVAGIQPCLSPEVGIPFETRVQRRVFPQALPAQPQGAVKDLPLLIAGLSEIINGEGEGVKRFVRDRLLIDVVCGAAQIAYAPGASLDEQTQSSSKIILKQTLDKTPIHYALPLLTSLVQNNPPAWFKSPLLEYLALIPLRPNGVRNIIDFVASAAPAAYDRPLDNEGSTNSHGPSLTSESLSRASRLLSSAPSSMNPDDYFRMLSEQLHPMLDGKYGPDLVLAAGHIIGSGILGRRDLGAPGRPGWIAFADPLIHALNPESNQQSQQKKSTRYVVTPLDKPLVSQHAVTTTVGRLLAILNATLSPGLTKRLISPVFLPLWGLYNYAFSRNKESPQAAMAMQLLRLYTSRCATSQQLSDLGSYLLWTGPSEWTYRPGDTGGVEIRCRTEEESDPTNMIETMLSLDQRLKSFIEILEVCPDDSIIGEIFVTASKRWLLPKSSKPSQRQVLEEDEVDPFQALVNASIAKAMIEHLQGRLMNSQVHIIHLVKQILEEYISQKSDQQRSGRSMEQASLKGLQHITNDSNTTKTQTERTEVEEMASMALSLLNAVLTSEYLGQTPASQASLDSLTSELSTLSEHGNSIPGPIRNTAQNLLSLIQSLRSEQPALSEDPLRSAHAVPASRKVTEDRARYNQALKDLASPSPPIRAEAIASIKSLVYSRSAIIDPQTTTHLLLNSVMRDEEDYVYLAGINCLVTLSSLHQAPVLRSLIHSYADRDQERALDERLRIGEAVAQILDARSKSTSKIETAVTSRNQGLEHSVAQYLAEALIGVSGRRGSRTKEAARKRQDEKRAEREARRAWGEDVPDIPDSLFGKIEAGDTEQNERLANILQGWEGSGEEEDARMRTSALSLLGKLLELFLDSVGQSPTNLALDLVINVVRLETGPEKAVLRRAAVMVVMGIVQGLDRIYEERAGQKREGSGVVELVDNIGTGLDRVVNELSGLEKSDEDDIVKGHVRSVLESIENWRMKALLGVSMDGRPVASHAGQGVQLAEGRLAGLDVNPSVTEQDSRRPGLVEVIEDE